MRSVRQSKDARGRRTGGSIERLAAMAAAATCFAAPAVAGAATPLTGTFLATKTPATITSGTCDRLGESTFTFTIEGPSSSPYAGTFRESGTVSMGPHTHEIPNAPGQFRARITSFDSSFTIDSPAGQVSGTKSLVPGTEHNWAGCTDVGWQQIAQIIASSLTYEATITLSAGSSFTDRGGTWDNFNAYSQPSSTGGSSGYEFRSNFSSSGTSGGSDTEAPKLTLPPTISVEATGASGAPVTYAVSATDDTDTAPAVSCSPASGSTFAIGTTTVRCAATDASGNTSSGTFDVIIAGARDSDGDGLSDVIEIMLGCDPRKADTDGDGIGDGTEVLLGTNPKLPDSNPEDGDDSDGSHLVRLYGSRCGCGPEDDADGDGVVTWVELKYGTDPGTKDSDGSGGYRSDLEYTWHLCGCKPVDDDGNGIPAMVEKFYGSSSALTIIGRCGCKPWDDPSGGGGTWRDFVLVGGPGGEEGDPDGDGLDTVIEIWLGCNPNDPDSDGDGLDDRRELELGTNPLERDTDGDGMDDKLEIELGCDPLDPDSDDDGRKDGDDNCPLVSNAGQGDLDGDGKGDTCDSRDDRFVAPPAGSTEHGTPCKVTYGGRIITTDGAKATLGGVAQPIEGGAKGQQEYQHHGGAGFNLHGMSVSAVRCIGSRATLWGEARLSETSVGFRIELVDAGEPGRGDTYRILVSDGYDSGARPLEQGGNVQIHKGQG